MLSYITNRCYSFILRTRQGSFRTFDKYDYQDVYKSIYQLRMKYNEKYNEKLDDFIDEFLHLCYEFSEEYLDYDFMAKKFQYLVQISLKQFKSESRDDFTLPTHINHDTYINSGEESTTHFIPSPPFDVGIGKY